MKIKSKRVKIVFDSFDSYNLVNFWNTCCLLFRIDCKAATSLLKPVVIYVFLESSSFKHQLANYLIQVLNRDYTDLIVELIKLYISTLKVIKFGFEIQECIIDLKLNRTLILIEKRSKKQSAHQVNWINHWFIQESVNQRAIGNQAELDRSREAFDQDRPRWKLQLFA
jgi:hypothetical protein